MSQPLKIRFATDVEGAKRGMTELAANVSANALSISSALKGANDNLQKLSGAFGNAKIAAVGLASAAAVAVGGYLLVSAAVAQANAQLDRFIRLGENAEKAGVGVGLFQRFSEAAEKAKLDIKAIETALLQAGKMVTPQFEESDQIRSRLTDLFESGFLGDRQSQGLADYRKANNNEDRIRAAVKAMQELQTAGERLAAIDLAERLFGADVAERIRSGRLEIDAIADSLDRKREDLISQEQVQTAEQFRDRLDAAYKAIDDALHVSVALEGSGRAVLNFWLAIAEATALAAKNANTYAERVADALKAASAGPMLPTPPLSSGVRTDGQGSIAADLGAVAGQGARGRTIYDKPIGPDRPGMSIENPPAPPRRPLDVVLNPEKYGIGVKPEAKGNSDQISQVESLVNGLEKSAAAIRAEAEAYGKSNAERQFSINLARAEEVAKQNNVKLTDAEVERIRAASKATADYRDKLDDLHDSQEFVRSSGGEFLKGIASDARNGVSAMDALTNAVGRLFSRLADKSLDGLADILFGKSGGNSTGAIGSLFSAFAGGFAGGGEIEAGKWALVGEKGPELIGASGMARTVIPNGGLRAGGAGGGGQPVFNFVDQRPIGSPDLDKTTRQNSSGGYDTLIRHVDDRIKAANRPKILKG